MAEPKPPADMSENERAAFLRGVANEREAVLEAFCEAKDFDPPENDVEGAIKRGDHNPEPLAGADRSATVRQPREAVACICGAKAAICPDNSYGSCVVSCSADCEDGPSYCLGVGDLNVAIIQWNDRIPELQELDRLRRLVDGSPVRQPGLERALELLDEVFCHANEGRRTAEYWSGLVTEYADELKNAMVNVHGSRDLKET